MYLDRLDRGGRGGRVDIAGQVGDLGLAGLDCRAVADYTGDFGDRIDRFHVRSSQDVCVVYCRALESNIRQRLLISTNHSSRSSK